AIESFHPDQTEDFASDVAAVCGAADRQKLRSPAVLLRRRHEPWDVTQVEYQLRLRSCRVAAPTELYGQTVPQSAKSHYGAPHHESAELAPGAERRTLSYEAQIRRGEELRRMQDIALHRSRRPGGRSIRKVRCAVAEFQSQAPNPDPRDARKHPED